MISKTDIVLISPRERVLRALQDSGSVACIIGGLTLLGAASPLALLAGSTSLLLGASTYALYENKAERKIKNLINPRSEWTNLTSHLANEAGLHSLKVTQDDGTLYNNRAIGRALTFGNNHYLMLANSQHPDMLHAVFHEFAHAARHDARQNSLKMYACGQALMFGAAISLMAGFAPAATGVAAMALGAAAIAPGVKNLASSFSHRVGGGPPPVHECEADRIASTFRNGELPQSGYCTPWSMAAHCDKMDVPRPRSIAHLPTTELHPLREKFNKLCSKICKPVTMPKPSFS